MLIRRGKKGQQRALLSVVVLVRRRKKNLTFFSFVGPLPHGRSTLSLFSPSLFLCSLFSSLSSHRDEDTMGAFAAVVLTVISSGGSAVGKAMQKQGTRSLPRLRLLDRRVVGEYLRCRAWVAGISLDVAGALLMVAAVAQAPVRKKEWTGRRRIRLQALKNQNSQLPLPCFATTAAAGEEKGRPFCSDFTSSLSSPPPPPDDNN